MANVLDDLEKICFSCKLPADQCGKPGVMCDYMVATRDCKPHRRKTPKIQHFCGFPDKNLDKD